MRGKDPLGQSEKNLISSGRYNERELLHCRRGSIASYTILSRRWRVKEILKNLYTHVCIKAEANFTTNFLSFEISMKQYGHMYVI